MEPDGPQKDSMRALTSPPPMYATGNVTSMASRIQRKRMKMRLGTLLSSASSLAQARPLVAITMARTVTMAAMPHPISAKL